MPFLLLSSPRVPVQRAVNDPPNLLPRWSPACCLSFWFLVTLLVLSQGPADAEWVVVETTQSGITAVYVEPDSIRRTEQMVKMWHVINFKRVQSYLGYAVLSVRAQGQYDCADERTRTLVETDFSSHMARGAVVYAYPNAGQWHPVAPQTIAHTLLQVACGKP